MIDDALRRELGPGLFEQLRRNADPSEEEAMALAVEVQHETRRR
ncbi:MAG: hypothetical protein ACRDL2_14240 [Gaiellaceae bacterium]